MFNEVEKETRRGDLCFWEDICFPIGLLGGPCLTHSLMSMKGLHGTKGI